MKASNVPRKRRSWQRTGISRYDPQPPVDRAILQDGINSLKLALQSSVGSCSFLHHLYDCQSPGTEEHKVMDPSDEEEFQAESPVPACEVEIVCEPLKSSDESERKQRHKHLYDLAGPSGVSDDETIGSKQLDETFARIEDHRRQKLRKNQGSAQENISAGSRHR